MYDAKAWKALGSPEVVITHIHPHLVQNYKSQILELRFPSPLAFFKQATGPPSPSPPKPLLAPKSGSFAKSSLMLNIHSSGVEKANSGKVQDWRQSEPHVRNSFLITGNALAHCRKMPWLIFLFLRVGLYFIVHTHNVLFPFSSFTFYSSASFLFHSNSQKAVLAVKIASSHLHWLEQDLFLGPARRWFWRALVETLSSLRPPVHFLSRSPGQF